MQRRTTGGLITALALTGLTTALSGPAAAVGPCGSGLVSGDDNRIGNLVFADLDGDGAFEPAAGETGIAGVTVELFADLDGDASFEPNGDDGAAVCVATTDAEGRYHFSPTTSGDWFVAVPIAPAGTESSAGATVDATTDNVDDGTPAAGYAAVSGVLALDLSTDQPLGEAAPGATAGTDEAAADLDGGAIADRDSNLTIDFGFETLTIPPTSPSTTTPSTTTPTTAPSTTAPSTTSPSTTAPSTTAPSTTSPSTTVPSTSSTTTPTSPTTTPPTTTPQDFDLGIVKTGAVEGSEIVWTLTVTNEGPGASGPLQVTDAIPGSVTLRSVSADAPLVCATEMGQGGTTVECHAADLAPGARADVTIRTSLPAADVCAVTNVATIEGAGVVVSDGEGDRTVTVDTDDGDDASSTTVRFDCGGLPVTGSSTGLLVGLSALLGVAGAGVMTWLQRARPVSIADRLG